MRDAPLSDEQARYRAEQVEIMTQSSEGWRYVREHLERRLADVDAAILAGNLDADLYRRYAGERKGLVAALEAPDELIRHAPTGGPDE